MAKKEINTGDMNISHEPDIDLSLDKNVVHGESLVMVAGDLTQHQEYMAALAFMEEPVTIRLEENSHSDFPETHVPVQVQSRGAEVLENGNWLTIGWLPIGAVVTTKRKYVEVLARAKSVSIKTKHDDATVERPRNTVIRRASSNYPMTVIRDDNPKGHEWLSQLMMAF